MTKNRIYIFLLIFEIVIIRLNVFYNKTKDAYKKIIYGL